MTIGSNAILDSTLVRVRDRLISLVPGERALSLAIVVVALLVGGFLRLWHLNTLGYNSDEAVYAGQSAAIAGVPGLRDLFPVFRAHPLLFQFVLALVYHYGVSDIAGRLVAVVAGLLTVLVVYRTGSLLYGPMTGAVGALLLACMPYHATVSRQFLLDGPMTLCSTCALYLLARYGLSRRPGALYATGAAIGMTALAKETGMILIVAVYAFFALSHEIPAKSRDLALASLAMFLVLAPFPASLMLAGGGGTSRAHQYLVWQFLRRPNHTWDFYPTMVTPAIGLLVVLVAAVGLWLLRRERSWREKLLLSWVLVPAVFFQLWPTKGFQYLLPITPPLALLAARAICAGIGEASRSYPALKLRWLPLPIPLLRPVAALARSERGRSLFRGGRLTQITPRGDLIRLAAGCLIVISLLLASWNTINTSAADSFLAGSGGVPGGRAAGLWVRTHTPAGSRLMTIGPSMANIIEFYGRKPAYGLAVSPNPLTRNPSYEPILNPELQLRRGSFQYVVWDVYSANRSPFFASKLLAYVRKYHGVAVHNESVPIKASGHRTVLKPVIVIYEVRP